MERNDQSDSILDENKSDKTLKEPKIKKKISKKLAIYYSIFGVVLLVLLTCGSFVIYTNLNYEIGWFDDLSMSPTINKTIKNKNEIYDNDNFINKDGNIVEYGFIDRHFTKNTLKRFDIVVTDNEMNGSSYNFEVFRLIGFPNETIKLDYDGNLFINGEPKKQPIPNEYLKLDWKNSEHLNHDLLFFEETLKDDEYYLLKDNRFYNTRDSRIFGGYKFDRIYAKVITINGTCEISGGKCIHRSWPMPRFI